MLVQKFDDVFVGGVAVVVEEEEETWGGVRATRRRNARGRPLHQVSLIESRSMTGLVLALLL